MSAQVKLHVVTVIWDEREPRSFREQLVTENPVRVEDVTLREILGVVILEDAARLDIRKSEGLGQIFHATSFHDRLIECFPAELHDRAIRPDSAGVQVHDVALLFVERDLDVSVPSSVFGQDLDSEIDVFMGG